MKKSVAVLLPYIEAEKASRLQEGESSKGAAKILMATVKGDVHDIGKNIVGVVLGCNGYDVIDLGVMVPADKILDAAQKEQVDIIGLSGLITPSLDEMVHVAKEMKRRGMTQPLMIGGATTSRMHTAVKIAPEYQHGVIHVLDASRSVNTAGQLLNEDLKKPFLQNLYSEYNHLKADFDNKKHAKELLSYTDACSNAAVLSTAYHTPQPARPGLTVFQDYNLNDIRNYIDWGPFFIAWEMKGKYPELLQDEHSGNEARKLFADANALLDKVIAQKWLVAQGVIGFWEAWKTAPDSVQLKDEQGNLLCQLEFLRQQSKKAEGQPNYSLADFIQAGKKDYLGAFAVSIHGIEPHLDAFAKQHDDYNKIMLQALADRLAEAFAELLHSRCRKEYWGYAANEAITPDALIHENYQGIRPAPGYPACPDHTEKYKLFDLLQAGKNAGIQLTESLAMYPAASVCGWYFSHPDSKYFGIGKIQEDQVIDYARRKGMSKDEATKWLSPNMD